MACLLRPVPVPLTEDASHPHDRVLIVPRGAAIWYSSMSGGSLYGYMSDQLRAASDHLYWVLVSLLDPV